MSKIELPTMKIKGFNDLFGGGETSVQIGPKCDFPVKEINLKDLYSFKDHPFKVQNDEKMQDLVDSIKQHGLMHPAIARPLSDEGYELIAGHRRKFACELLGIESMPVHVVEVDDDEATILMVQTNFCQREELLPSEKAKGYRREFEARKHQGTGGGLTAEVIGEETGDSVSTVKRYIRLSYLIDEFLELVDQKKLGPMQGYDIAFLDEDAQQMIYEAIERMGVNVTPEHSVRLKEYGLKGNLTEDMVELILSEKKVKPRRFSMKAERLNEYFTEEYSEEMIEEVIFSLLDAWKRGGSR